MSDTVSTSAGRAVLIAVIVFTRRDLNGSTPEMVPGIRAARHLRNLLAGILLLSFAQSFWANIIAGSDMPLQPVTLRGGIVGEEKASATLHLTPEMNQVRLLFHRKVDARYSIDFHFTIRAPDGKEIHRAFAGDYGTASPQKPFNEGTSRLDIFSVPSAGDYTVNIMAVQRRQATEIANAAIGVATKVHGSHFILTVFLVMGGALLAGKWWQRRHGWIIDAMLNNFDQAHLSPQPLVGPTIPGRIPASAPDSLPPASADLKSTDSPVTPPPLAAGTSRMRLRSVLVTTPAMVSAPPPTAASPARKPEVAEMTPRFERFKTRAVLEVWSLALSAAQVPVVGFYTMLLLIAIMGSLGSADAVTMDAIFKSPVFTAVMRWFFPEGHYEGFEVLWRMGQAGGAVLLLYHLLLMPVRALWPRRQRRTFGQKIGLLLKANLALLIVFTGVFLLSGMKGSKILDGVTVVAILEAVVFIPAAVLLGIGGKLQEKLDAMEEPSGK